MMGFNEVIDGEIVFALVQAGATSYNLLELNHVIIGAHKYDVTHITGIHPGREFTGGG
jgi:hypothetical protein